MGFDFLWIDSIDWPNLIAGAVIGSLLIPITFKIIKRIQLWWVDTRPKNLLFGEIVKPRSKVKIFVRDLYLSDDSKLVSISPNVGLGLVPNIDHVWPDVEGIGSSFILNVLGDVGKTKNIEIVRMSQDKGEWATNIIVLGAQAQKSFDFYDSMENVAYSMTADSILDCDGKVVERKDATSYGYGIILKAKNPYIRNGLGFLIGGYGVLGTSAAVNYFSSHYEDLGKEFGKDYFGILVRAKVSAGVESTERLKEFDKRIPFIK